MPTTPSNHSPPHQPLSPRPHHEHGRPVRAPLAFRAPPEAPIPFGRRLLLAALLRGKRWPWLGTVTAVATAIQAVAMLVIATRPLDRLPITIDFWEPDKILHAIAFAWFGGWAMVSLHHLTRLSVLHSAALTVLVAGIGWGAVIEFAQSFTPHRSPELFDVVADGVGCAFIATILLLVSRPE